MKTLVVFLLMAGAAYAQTPLKDTSCMALWFNLHTDPYIPNTLANDSLANIRFNPDSVAEDTCSSNPGEIWLKHGWDIIFTKPLVDSSPGLQIPNVQDDSATELVDWTAIDTSFPIARQAMKAVYDSVGPFKLRKKFPSYADPYFMFQFDTWTSNDSIGKYIMHYNTSDSYFWLDATISFHGSDSVKLSVAGLQVWPQPASEILYVSDAAPQKQMYLIDPLGRRIRSWKSESSDTGVIELDLHGLSAGVYFLQSENFTRKVVISH